MMTQSFVGTTTIVPQVELRDFFVLFSDPTISRLYHYLRVGSVAAYQHAAMIRCHYRIADALEECIEKLETTTNGHPNTTSIEPECFVESTKKKRVSRRASFEVGDMAFKSGSLPQYSQKQQQPARQDRVPEIITSGSKPSRDGDSNSVSTSSETYVPTL